MIDHAELLSLLLLKRELLGYPGAHPSLNYMVDAAITDAETAAKPEAASHLESKKMAEAKAKADAEAKAAADAKASAPKAIPSSTMNPGPMAPAHFPPGHNANG